MLWAQRSLEVRLPLRAVADALTARNAHEAMIPFDKAFAKRDQLERYFQGLTDGHTITNELDVTDEEIDNGQATLTVHWVLTLGDTTNNLTVRRERDLTIILAEKKNRWHIVELTPIEFFDPDASTSN